MGGPEWEGACVGRDGVTECRWNGVSVARSVGGTTIIGCLLRASSYDKD